MKTVRQRPGELSAIERIKLCNQFINGGIKIIEGSDWYHFVRLQHDAEGFTLSVV
jgi:hypothetical protein